MKIPIKIGKMLIVSAVLVVVGAGAWFGYKKFIAKPKASLFKAKKPEKRKIYKKVNAEGELEAQGYSKIGPLIPGTVKKIYVEDDQVVKKGQLLAQLANTTGEDTLVRQRKGELDDTLAHYDYVAANYKRQKVLYEADQLSKDAFDRVTEMHLRAKADVDIKQAAYDREVILYSYTKICSPIDGTILSIEVKEGEAVSLSSSTPSVLFQIAQDLSVMKVNLKIDESKVGDIKPGLVAKIKVDTYPDRLPWRGKIETVGHAPMPSKNNGGNNSSPKGVVYKAVVMLKDKEKLLRPGMTVHAEITVAKMKDALALPGHVFQISDKAVKAVAKILGYQFKPLSEDQKKALYKKRKIEKTGPYHFVWVVDGKSFVEKGVKTGVNDGSYFHILSGVNESDEVVHDIEETDEMKELYKKWFGGGL